MACRILVSQPGIELGPLALKSPSPNHWTSREFPAACVLAGSNPPHLEEAPGTHYQDRWRELPGGPVVKTPRFHCRGHGFDPWSGN